MSYIFMGHTQVRSRFFWAGSGRNVAVLRHHCVSM